MKYTRDDYRKFLLTEFDTKKNNFDKLINVEALVLKERGDVFVGMFMNVNEQGIAVFKVRTAENMPRRNSFWTAVYLIGDMSKHKNWGGLSWRRLRNEHQKTYSDAFCAWIGAAEDPKYCLVGIKNLTIDFVTLLKGGNTIIAFGPQDPPLQYLFNLIELVKITDNNEIKKILDYSIAENRWNPQFMGSKCDFSSTLLQSFTNNDCIVIQGPPGTGKTYRMAEFASKLLADGNSVLVTALTNQALMELAKKTFLESFLKAHKVSKTSLSTDERKELPNLQPIKDNACNATRGCLTLATFYIASEWAFKSIEKQFDYVIVDEASQAYLPMIAAAMKIAKKLVLIGDQKQLSPIVETNEDIIVEHHWNEIVSGFETICKYFDFKSFMLCDTFRLTKRAAESTGFFYDNALQSVSSIQTVPTNIDEINKLGGPIFVGLNMQIGDTKPENAFDYICQLVKKIITENSKVEIAVLAKFKDTVKNLQKKFAVEKLPDKIKIETVDRVQGLTVDFCFFLIPNYSHSRSLEASLFNVATSRAKYCTIIVADKNIMSEPMSDEVRKYLLKAQEDSFATFESKEPKTISNGNIKVSVVGKIDLPENKGKTYVIDTNVFVECPDIINKIGNKNKIIIPAKVLDELDKLKLNPETDKQKLNKASRNITEAFTKNFSQMEAADVSLLPVGFDKKTPDCMILSVALKHKDEKVILLTSDLNLQARASGLNIKVKSLRDFLKNN